MDPILPPWMEDAFVTRRREAAAAVVRASFADVFDRLGLVEAADLPPDAFLWRAEEAYGTEGEVWRAGRGRMALLPDGGGEGAVLRPCRRGGWVRRITERRYLLGDRAFRELAVTEGARRRGAPVPEPLAAVQSGAGIGYRAALLTRRIPDARPSPELLDGLSPDACRPLLFRMGAGAGLLHRAGGWHPDLNAHNLLLTAGGGPARVVDLDRGRLFDGPAPRPLVGWAHRRLRRSLRKLGLDAALLAWGAFREGHDRPGGA